MPGVLSSPLHFLDLPEKRDTKKNAPVDFFVHKKNAVS